VPDEKIDEFIPNIHGQKLPGLLSPSKSTCYGEFCLTSGAGT